jgi:hypothetical protein
VEAAFLFCTDATARADGKLDIHGVFNELYAPDFPARQDRMVLVGIVEWPREVEGRVPFAVDLVDAEGMAIFSIDGHTDVDARPPSRAPAKSHFILPLENVMFPVPGDYRLQIRLNDRELQGPSMHLLRTA